MLREDFHLIRKLKLGRIKFSMKAMNEKIC